MHFLFFPQIQIFQIKILNKYLQLLEYERLLSITGKNKIADITKEVGIDIHDKEFWKNSLKTIEEDIEKFIMLSKKH